VGQRARRKIASSSLLVAAGSFSEPTDEERSAAAHPRDATISQGVRLQALLAGSLFVVAVTVTAESGPRCGPVGCNVLTREP
jgi:hypothetical protein